MREPEIIVFPEGTQIISRREQTMRYQSPGPFGPSRAISAESLNTLEDFLSVIPAEHPYQRCGPFVNGQSVLGSSFFDGIEHFLSQVESENPYQCLGPFSGARASNTPLAGLLNHIERFLSTLNVDPTKRCMTPIQQIGASKPLGWMDNQGEFIRNPDYIEPAKLPEPVQYGQCLVEYDYGR